MTAGHSPQLIADAGTTLMWAGFLHLVVGNALIGLLEAAIVRRIFKVRGRALFFWAIAANYCSFIVGGVMVAVYGHAAVQWIGGSLPIYSLGRILIALTLLSLLLTVAVEWLFYWAAMRRQAPGLVRSLEATALVNLASYAVLAGYYGLFSSGPLEWGVSLRPVSQMDPHPAARVLYISPDHDGVYSIRLDGSKPVRFCPLVNADDYSILTVLPGTGGDGSRRLGIGDLGHDPSEARPIADLRQVRATTEPMRDFGSAVTIDPPNGNAPSPWELDVGFGFPTGVHAFNQATGQGGLIIAVETPWVGWVARCATVFSNDQAVFELGEQIIWVDLKNKRAAAIAAGYGPVVVVDDGMAASKP